MSTSPYAAPPTPVPSPASFPPPAAGRPTGVTVFAILNIVFGIMGLLGTIFSTVFLLVGSNFEMGANPTLEALENIPLYRGFMIVSMVLAVIFSILLLVSGVGLLNMSSQGRTLAIVYGVYGIVSAVVSNLVNLFVVVWPMLDKANAGGTPSAVVVGTIFGTVVGAVVGLIFPVATLIYFLRPNVREMFAREQAA